MDSRSSMVLRAEFIPLASCTIPYKYSHHTVSLGGNTKLGRWGMTPMHMTGLGQHPYGIPDLDSGLGSWLEGLGSIIGSRRCKVRLLFLVGAFACTGPTSWKVNSWCWTLYLCSLAFSSQNYAQGQADIPWSLSSQWPNSLPFVAWPFESQVLRCACFGSSCRWVQQTPWLVTRSRDSALLLVQEGAQSLKLSDEVILFWGQLFNIGGNRSAVSRHEGCSGQPTWAGLGLRCG